MGAAGAAESMTRRPTVFAASVRTTNAPQATLETPMKPTMPLFEAMAPAGSMMNASAATYPSQHVA